MSKPKIDSSLVRTAICPVCRTCHSGPPCPAPGSRGKRFVPTFQPFTYEDLSYLYELARTEEMQMPEQRYLDKEIPAGLLAKLTEALGI